VPFAGRMAALEPADDESDDGKPKLPPGKLYPLPPPRLPPPVLDYGGLAVHDYEDGSRYAGDWVRGMRSGWGVFTTPDGVRYAGEWRTDRYDGLGIVRYASGNRYEGEFLANKRHGRGLFLWKTTGEVYYGLWDNDLRMGQGCHMWPDGSKYEGEWAQGLQQGRGRYVWADGRKYEGDFSQGKRTGDGIATSANGRKFKGGVWENGTMVKESKLILERNHTTKAMYPIGRLGNYLTQVQLLCEDARLMSLTMPLYALCAKKAAAVAETHAAKAIELRDGKRPSTMVIAPAVAPEAPAAEAAAAPGDAAVPGDAASPGSVSHGTTSYAYTGSSYEESEEEEEAEESGGSDEEADDSSSESASEGDKATATHSSTSYDSDFSSSYYSGDSSSASRSRSNPLYSSEASSEDASGSGPPSSSSWRPHPSRQQSRLPQVAEESEDDGLPSLRGQNLLQEAKRTTRADT